MSRSVKKMAENDYQKQLKELISFYRDALKDKEQEKDKILISIQKTVESINEKVDNIIEILEEEEEDSDGEVNKQINNWTPEKLLEMYNALTSKKV